MVGQENDSGCPLGLDVFAIVDAIAKKDTKGAAEKIVNNNPLPSICGRVCNAPCKGSGKVKNENLMQFAQVRGEAAQIKVSDNAKKVAVIGGGPAGLAAAHRLLQLGMKPTVFEASNAVGGMLADVIPSFVLPREMLAHDIANLKEMGVDIQTGKKAGKDVDWSFLENNYDAVLIATGAGKGIIPKIPGIKLKGATNAIDFLRDSKPDVNGTNVVVQGGGAASIQVARAAKKLGAARVMVVHPFPLNLWSAGIEDIESAKKESIELLPENRVTELWGFGVLDTVIARPVQYALKDSRGRIAGIDMGKQMRLSADVFVASVNRQPMENPGLSNYKKGMIGNLEVDEGYRLAGKNWYAAGEAATGAAGVVGSMATGQLAAEVIKKDSEAK